MQAKLYARLRRKLRRLTKRNARLEDENALLKSHVAATQSVDLKDDLKNFVEGSHRLALHSFERTHQKHLLISLAHGLVSGTVPIDSVAFDVVSSQVHAWRATKSGKASKPGPYSRSEHAF